MRRFFTKPAGMTPGMALIQFCGIVFGLLHLASLLLPGATTVEGVSAAVLLYAGSLMLFWWAFQTNRRTPLSAAFSPDVPMQLVQNGPYQFIRHPFYASYLMTWLAGPIASGRPSLLATTILMGSIYYVAARSEEKKFENSPLAQEYRRYKLRTGLFAPNVLKITNAARAQANVIRNT
jgi:protein-S-isoprenylcysteine O-methyltransferase Ste14